MANMFNLKIVACDGVFYDDQCEMIIFPGIDGEVAVMAHHEPMTAAIEIGEIRFKDADGEWRHAVISDGLLSVYKDGTVKMMVYSCERPEDIDTFRAQEALERAQEQLREKQSIQEYHISTANMARAMARLKSASHPGASYNK